MVSLTVLPDTHRWTCCWKFFTPTCCTRALDRQGRLSERYTRQYDKRQIVECGGRGKRLLSELADVLTGYRF
jgi:hypothetical protein